MDPLFSEFEIFASRGQKYTPVDHKMLLNYKESESGRSFRKEFRRQEPLPHGYQVLLRILVQTLLHSFLHLLLNVRISEGRGSDLECCRRSRARLPDGRDSGADHA